MASCLHQTRVNADARPDGLHSPVNLFQVENVFPALLGFVRGKALLFMYDAVSVKVFNDNAPRMQRVSGRGHVGFKHASGRTRLNDLHQSGSAKIRLPKVYDGVPVAVLINTAGGLTGGDRLAFAADIDAGAHAIVTSQAAERAYRSSGGVAEVENRLSAGNGATLEWLPQETILFNASGLHRSMSVDLVGDARLLAVESVVLGRTAMGETVDRVTFRDRWRIHRDGRLLFADDVRLEGDAGDILKGPATAGGGLAFATLVDCAVDADTRLGLARDALGQLGIRAAASAWNGVLVARFVGADGRALRDGLISFLETYRSADLPRVWHC